MRYWKPNSTISAPSSALFTPAIAAFRQRYSKVELKLFERGSKAIEATLIDGELELGGVLQPVDTEMFDVLPVSRQLLWLVAPKGSRWDAANEVSLADLASEPFVFYGESLALNDVVLNACREVGFMPTIVGRSGHRDFMAAMVQAGIALLPAPYCRRFDADVFTCRRVVAPEIRWDMAVGWRRNGYLSHVARAWLDVVREMLPANIDQDFMADGFPRAKGSRTTRERLAYSLIRAAGKPERADPHRAVTGGRINPLA